MGIPFVGVGHLQGAHHRTGNVLGNRLIVQSYGGRSLVVGHIFDGNVELLAVAQRRGT